MPNQYPVISIVTPSFNQGEYIEQTILSVLEQNYPNLEYIIIDGGSTDNSVEIIKKYEKYITYWVSEKDNGQSHAINKGLQKCTGEVFNWLNSDDYLEKDSLHHIADLFASQNPAMVIGKLRIFNDTTHREYIYSGKAQNKPESELLFHLMSQPSMFYSMEVIRQLGGKVSESLRYIMDLELWCRFRFRLPEAKICYTEQLLAHFREHGTSKTVSERTRFKNEIERLTFSLVTQLDIPSGLYELFVPDSTNRQIIPEVFQDIGTYVNRDRFFHTYFEYRLHKNITWQQKFALWRKYISYKPYALGTYKRLLIDYLKI